MSRERGGRVLAYYNDKDPKCCAWMRELARRGLITDGTVDSRSIRDITGADLAGYERVHLFAGIAGWDYALRLAGWPDGRPVWTGSAPCQPFSSAGKQQGHQDERHLWPEMLRLVTECRPPVIIGEQVASRLGRDWLAGVRADLEALGYAVGAADLCAAGVGAPHIRQRLYWVAVAGRGGVRSERLDLGITSEGVQGAAREQRFRTDDWDGRPTGSGLADAGRDERGRRAGLRHDGQGPCGTREEVRLRPGPDDGDGGAGSGLGHASSDGSAAGIPRPQPWQEGDAGVVDHAGSPANFWSDAVWLPCRDGKQRRIGPGVAPLAHGVPARVVRLRGYGNAICAPLAATFVRSVMEVLGD